MLHTHTGDTGGVRGHFLCNCGHNFLTIYGIWDHLVVSGWLPCAIENVATKKGISWLVTLETITFHKNGLSPNEWAKYVCRGRMSEHSAKNCRLIAALVQKFNILSDLNGFFSKYTFPSYALLFGKGSNMRCHFF